MSDQPSSRTTSASPEPMGPFYVFEAEREAALGDVLRGKRSDKAEAIAFAETLNRLHRHRTFVLSAAGTHIRTFNTDDAVSTP